MVYGYARVSTREQNEDRQLIALHEVGVADEHLYLDKQSGKDFERPAYQALVAALQKDDLLYIKSIDRLGRNYDEIIEQWRMLTKEIGADVVVLDMPLLDTRRGKDLLGTFLSDIVLQVLSFVAENERNNIRQRQAEGITAAKARGVKFGRPSGEVPENFVEIAEQWQAGELTGTEAAEQLGMSLSTFRYRAKKMGFQSSGYAASIQNKHAKAKSGKNKETSTKPKKKPEYNLKKPERQPLPKNFKPTALMVQCGLITQKKGAEMCGMSVTTFARRYRELITRMAYESGEYS